VKRGRLLAGLTVPLFVVMISAVPMSPAPSAVRSGPSPTTSAVRSGPGPAALTAPSERQLLAAIGTALHRNLRYSPPVIYPSNAYSNPYLRDSFWAAQAYGQRAFSVPILDAFAAAERADGDPPTDFNSPYHGPVYRDDESAALLLIWAWRNHTLYGVTPPIALLQRALSYLLSRQRNGYLVTPPGMFHSWWDAYNWPTATAIAYNQGLYAVAIRCAKLLGLSSIPLHGIASAEQAYRGLYNPQLGYMQLSATLAASDASALTGEFLSLWIFNRPILTDSMVLSTLSHLKPFGAGYYVAALPQGDGSFPETAALGAPGYYQNGASWLLYDALSIGAAGLHGLPDALPRLQARLALEFRRDVTLHEFLETNPTLPDYGAEPVWRDTFSWDMFALVVDQTLHK